MGGYRASLKLWALAPGVVPREGARRPFLASSSWPLPELTGQVLGIVMGPPPPCHGDLPRTGYILLRVVGITRILANDQHPLALLCPRGPLGWFWPCFPAMR